MSNSQSPSKIGILPWKESSFPGICLGDVLVWVSKKSDPLVFYFKGEGHTSLLAGSLSKDYLGVHGSDRNSRAIGGSNPFTSARSRTSLCTSTNHRGRFWQILIRRSFELLLHGWFQHCMLRWHYCCISMGGPWDIWDGRLFSENPTLDSRTEKHWSLFVVTANEESVWYFCSHFFRWWVHIFLCFTLTWGNEPNLTCAYFFKRVGSTTGRSTFIVSFFWGEP